MFGDKADGGAERDKWALTTQFVSSPSHGGELILLLNWTCASDTDVTCGCTAGLVMTAQHRCPRGRWQSSAHQEGRGGGSRHFKPVISDGPACVYVLEETRERPPTVAAWDAPWICYHKTVKHIWAWKKKKKPFQHLKKQNRRHVSQISEPVVTSQSHPLHSLPMRLESPLQIVKTMIHCGKNRVCVWFPRKFRLISHCLNVSISILLSCGLVPGNHHRWVCFILWVVHGRHLHYFKMTAPHQQLPFLGFRNPQVLIPVQLWHLQYEPKWRHVTSNELETKDFRLKSE